MKKFYVVNDKGEKLTEGTNSPYEVYKELDAWQEFNPDAEFDILVES